jgi:cell division protease FtsH
MSEPPAGKQPPQSGSSWQGTILWLIIVVMLSTLLLRDKSGPVEIPYSTFKQDLRSGLIDSVTFRGNDIHGAYKLAAGTEKPDFQTILPVMADADLVGLLEEQQVVVRVQSTEYAHWMVILINLFPWVILIGLFMLSRRLLGKQIFPGGGGFTSSRARLAEGEEVKTRYDDIAGLKNAKEDLFEIIDFLKNPTRYKKLGANIPKGILLMGSPGTGKTLLAKATAGEAGVPFFSITGSEFVEMYVGVGASRVRDMFTRARAAAPSLIFIDEIDSVGRARSGTFGMSNDEREQTLNQILAEMDGFREEETVVVLAATNRPDVLDSALLRPGRFDRKVVLDLPQRQARVDILRVHTRRVPLAADVDLESIAMGTVGFSGADLANLVNEAALLAARRDRTEVGQEEFENARDRVILGERRETLFSEEEKRRIAYHEAGHALVAHHLPHADSLRKISIIPRGRSLGMTEQSANEDMLNYSQHYLEDRLVILLGGRTAELVVFDEVSSGAADDLKQATHLAKHMITEWGMSDALGPVTFQESEENFLGHEQMQHEYSDSTAEKIDGEISRIIKQSEDRAVALLQAHRDQLDLLADGLMHHETLNEEQILQLLGQVPA